MAKKSPAKKNKKPASRDNPFGSGFWRTHWKEALVIFTVAVALYVRCIPYDFVLDDQIVITDNEFTKNGFSGIPDIFGNDSFTGYFGEQKNLVAGSRYRPLSIAMFAIEYELAGLDPGLYHAVNIFLYGILCLLLFRVLHVILPSSSRVATHWLLGVPFIATLLFALHPIHTEAVANIKGRDEILALLFSLLAVYAGLRYAWRNAWPWLLASGVFLFTGILAKENAITFTAVIPLTLYFFTETNWKKWMLSAVPAAVASVSYVLIRLKVVGFLFAPTTSNSLLNDPFLGMSAAERSATITYTLGHYVRLLFFPVQLTHDYYPYHIPKSNWSDPAVILAAMIYLLFAVAAIYGFRRKAVYSYSILFFLATMSIISNVFFSIGTFMNERFAFMPSVAMCLVTAFYALRLHQDKRMPRWLIPAFLALYLGGFAVRSYTRIPAWKDRLSLNTAAVKVSKNSARANCFMGTALFERARELPDRDERYAGMLEAEKYIDRAIEIIPDYLDANQMKSGIMAEHYRVDRDLDRLLAGFEEVLSRKANVQYIPKYCEYLNGVSPDANKMRDFYYRAGYEILGVAKREYDYALLYLQLGLAFDPNDARLNYAMALIYQAKGDQARANPYLQKAYQLNPQLRK